jgi:hypothetical protein
MKNTNNLFGNGDKQEILVSRPYTALLGKGNVCRPARPSSEYGLLNGGIKGEMQSLLQLISGVHRSWIFFDAENSTGLGETNDPERLLSTKCKVDSKWVAW